jgi:hypothetical protein
MHWYLKTGRRLPTGSWVVNSNGDGNIKHSMENYINYVRLHPESVAVLFEKYGINEPITENALESAVDNFGDEFLNELATYTANQYVYFIGANGKAKAKKKPVSKLKAAIIHKKTGKKMAQTGFEPKTATSPAGLAIAKTGKMSGNISEEDGPPTPQLPELTRQREEILEELATPKNPVVAQMAEKLREQLQPHPQKGKFIDRVLDITEGLRGRREPEPAPKEDDEAKKEKRTGMIALGIGIAIIIALLIFYAKNKGDG